MSKSVGKNPEVIKILDSPDLRKSRDKRSYRALRYLRDISPLIRILYL